jgi:HSP20 family protein
MANLVRWDPFGEMVSLRQAMDELFENALIGTSAPRGSSMQPTSGGSLPLDVTENENSYVVTASIPGIDPNDLDISVLDNTLTIKGEVKAETEDKNTRYHVRERRWGAFSRSVALPMAVKADAVQAEYTQGVLKLTLPKTEEVKPRRIQIKTNGQKTIEGQTTTGQNK